MEGFEIGRFGVVDQDFVKEERGRVDEGGFEEIR